MADPVDIFRDEARELLVALEHALIGLESDPDDAELIGSAFRALHTIKGSGSMFGLDDISQLAHSLEYAFVELREGRARVTHELIDQTLSGRDLLLELIGGAEMDGAMRARADGVVREMTRLVGLDDAGRGAPTPGAAKDVGPAAAASGPRGIRVTYRPSPATFVNGTNPLGLLKELRDLGDATVIGYASTIPSLDTFDPLQCYFGWDVLLWTDAPSAAIDDVFMFADDLTRHEIVELESHEHRRIGDILVERGAIGPEDLDRLIARRPPVGEMLVEEGAVAEESVRSALEEQRMAARSRPATPSSVGESSAAIRVPTERLDRLVNLVGEFVSLQAQMTSRVQLVEDRELASLTESLERLVREARELSMEMHMVPIETLFSPFRRLVRDLASELGKQVVLTVEGADTELDRNVVDALRDPLLHIVRNALDHGIEPPEERRAAGKEEQGTLTLRAGYTGALVTIAIVDDGRGIDPDRIRARAVERGLVAADAELSRDRIMSLVFEPGFSTAATATQVSGRGVGMDVVRRNVEALGGHVNLRSVTGRGSTIELRIPLTLAIVEGLLCRIAGQYFLVNLGYVAECIDAHASHVSLERGFFDFRGSVVPIVDLAEYYGLDRAGDPGALVVVSNGQTRTALAVDELIGNHQSVVKSLGSMFSNRVGISGVVFLGDGTPALMVDVEELVRQADQRILG